jgi:FMN phosphatase YigB (HAD superfamily)
MFIHLKVVRAGDTISSRKVRRTRVISAVLFDLDGTLLDIDLEPFLRDYFGLLGPAIAGLLGSEATAADALAAVIAGTEAMYEHHEGRTNVEVFNEIFFDTTGVDLTDGEVADHITRFYLDEFPTLKGTHGPRPGALEAVEAARSIGAKVVLATNPIFPLAAIAERARWAGLTPEDFDLVTSYERMEACKPSPAYYRHIAAAVDVSPAECIMIGDDPVLDLAAADVGMRTFYVGPAMPVVSDWSGSLEDLAELLPRLVE